MPSRPLRARPPALGARRAAGARTCAVITAPRCFMGQSTAGQALQRARAWGACFVRGTHGSPRQWSGKGRCRRARKQRRRVARDAAHLRPGACGSARVRARARARGGARAGRRGGREARGPGGTEAGRRGDREARRPGGGAGGRKARRGAGGGGRAPCAPRRTWPAARPWPARRAGARCPGRTAGARPRGSPRAPHAGPARRRARPRRCRGATRPRGATRRAGLPQPGRSAQPYLLYSRPKTRWMPWACRLLICAALRRGPSPCPQACASLLMRPSGLHAVSGLQCRDDAQALCV